MIEDRPTEETTLKVARDWLRSEAKTGARCPCCRQYVKVYRRKLNSSMSRALLIMFKNRGVDWTHADHVVRAASTRMGHDWIGVHYWDLIEAHPYDAGYWRITAPGINFARNRLNVLSHAVVYNGKRLRLEGKLVSIVTTLGKHFNYDELMAERPLAREPS